MIKIGLSLIKLANRNLYAGLDKRKLILPPPKSAPMEKSKKPMIHKALLLSSILFKISNALSSH